MTNKEIGTKYNSLIQVSEYFKNEEICKEHLAKLRWNGNITCPHCANDKIYTTNRGYKCAKCLKKFSVITGTFFENTKISLRKWFMALYIATSHKKGISSLQLSKDIAVTQKTAWFILHRIREMLKDKAPQMLSGIVEADETYIGGKEKNKHRSKRQSGTKGRSANVKAPVMGLFERDGNIISKPVDSVSQYMLQGVIVKNVKAGSEIITDEWGGYLGLKKRYTHNVIKHGQGLYGIGHIHTNTIEGFWSLLKRGIIGIYHSVSEKHLEKYCNEFNFRYNSRFSNEQDRFDKSISQCKGRLKYKVLISNT